MVENYMKSSYPMIFDKDRDEMMTVIFNFLVVEHGTDWALAMAETGIAETFLNFIDEKATKTHERDWCQDPDCQYKNKDERR